MRTLTLKLPPELDTRLATAAQRRRTSKSELARQALEAYLSGDRSLGGGSILERAADLIGSLEGPGDLSHNPRFMEDFGR